MAVPFRLATRGPANLPTSTLTLLRAAPRQSHPQPAAQRLFSSSARQHFASPRRQQQTLRARQPIRRSYSSQPPKKDPNRVAFWPFLVLVGAATGAWILLVNNRKGEPGS